jgi:hypothetical protein
LARDTSGELSCFARGACCEAAAACTDGAAGVAFEMGTAAGARSTIGSGALRGTTGATSSRRDASFGIGSSFGGRKLSGMSQSPPGISLKIGLGWPAPLAIRPPPGKASARGVAGVLCAGSRLATGAVPPGDSPSSPVSVRGLVPSTTIDALHFLHLSETTRPATRRS